MERSSEEISREYDARMAAGTEFEGLAPVKARVSKQARAVFSVRLAAEELQMISIAARDRRVTVGEFIRMAALAAVGSNLHLESAEYVGELSKLLQQSLALSHGLRNALVHGETQEQQQSQLGASENFGVQAR